MVDRVSSRKPWMTVAGNHEEEVLARCGKSLNTTFASYLARYGEILPYEESGSGSAHYYSFETAGVHVVMLGSSPFSR
jgi:acid phosphatase type 7